MGGTVAVTAGPAATVDRRAVTAYLAAFGVGLVAGLVEWSIGADTTSSGAGVGTANAVHVVIAAVTAAVLATAWRRDPAGLRAWLRTPITTVGWRRSLDALLALPLALVELVLVVAGARHRADRIEAWRARRLRLRLRDGGRRPALLGLLVGLVATLAVVLTVQSVARAGEQVFAAIDPDFTRDAWGGPSYLGASLAHWMDGALVFAAGSVVIARAARWRHGVTPATAAAPALGPA